MARAHRISLRNDGRIGVEQPGLPQVRSARPALLGQLLARLEDHFAPERVAGEDERRVFVDGQPRITEEREHVRSGGRYCMGRREGPSVHRSSLTDRAPADREG